MKHIIFNSRNLGKSDKQRKAVARMVANGIKVVPIGGYNSKKMMNTNPANILKEQGYFDTDN